MGLLTDRKERGISILQSELSRVIEWVKFADRKISYVLIVYSILISFFISKIGIVYDDFIYGEYNLTHILFFIISGLILVGLVKIYLTVIPRDNNLKEHNRVNPVRPLLFYGKVAEYSIFESYEREVKNISISETKRLMLEQIFINSIIASKKMYHVKGAIQILIAIFCLSLTYLLLNYNLLLGKQ